MMKSHSQRFRKPQLFFSILFALSFTPALNAQQLYDDAEGNKLICYRINRGSKIDSTCANPAVNDVNGSDKCVKYVRSRIKYDCLRINPQGRIGDVGMFASYEPGTPKFRVKVYTTAPVGTLIEIQLGKKTQVPYPDGVHSHYQARTTVQNAWEELEFSYAFSPNGSKTGPGEVEFLTILVNPNSVQSDTYYFDELVGPTIHRDQVTSRGKRR